MTLLWLILGLSSAETPKLASIAMPTIDDAAALIKGCSEPGVCDFACYEGATQLAEPARNGSFRLTCDADGKAHGPLVVWFGSGRPEGAGFSKNGVPHGGYRSWHPNGQRATEGQWSDGKQEGELQSWYANGMRESLGLWRDGQQHGLVTYWHDNGGVQEIGNWVDGLPHGPMFSWYPDGTHRAVARYSQGTPKGVWREWHPNGRRHVVARYRDGVELVVRCWSDAGKRKTCDHGKRAPQDAPATAH